MEPVCSGVVTPGGSSMMRMLRKWISAPSDLQAEIAFLLRRLADAVDELAVHRELDRAVDRHDVIGVPLPPPFRAVLDRHAARAARIVRDELVAADREELAVHVGNRRRRLPLFGLQLHPVEIQDLNLDASRPGFARRSTRRGPSFRPARCASSRSAARSSRSAFGAHHAVGTAGAHQHAVADRPRFLGAGGDGPSRSGPCR